MSNIEEDIKILEKFNPGDEYTEKIKIAIENILEERKQDKARIQELEEENKNYVLNGNNVKLELHIKDNYISKQKVKDKIEELENAKRETTRENWYYIYTIQIDILNELLEDK